MTDADTLRQRIREGRPWLKGWEMKLDGAIIAPVVGRVQDLVAIKLVTAEMLEWLVDASTARIGDLPRRDGQSIFAALDAVCCAAQDAEWEPPDPEGDNINDRRAAPR